MSMAKYYFTNGFAQISVQPALKHQKQMSKTRKQKKQETRKAEKNK